LIAIISTAMIASSTSSPQRQDQRAERDLVQPDVEHPHEQERHAEHQRNRNGHDQAGAQPQAQQRYGEHDHHRFAERAHELVDRALNRFRHAGDRRDLDAHRQLRADARDLRVERVSEFDHVAALRHRHADAERFTPLPAHFLLRRIDIAAVNVRDVAEAQRSIVGADREFANRLQRVERPGRSQVNAIGRGVEHAGRGHGVLRHQRREDRRGLDAEQRELAVGELDEYALFLLTDEVDLGHTGDAQQLRAHLVAEFLQLAIAEAVTGQRVDVRIGVAELVVEERALDAGRQRVAHVADLLAHLVPRLGHAGRGGRILDCEKHQRFAGLRIAAQPVDVGDFLQLALELVGDLLLHFARGGAGPVGLDDHHLERERRILGLPEPLVRHEPDRREHDDQVQHERSVLECPFRQVEARAGRAPGRRDGGHGVAESGVRNARRSPVRGSRRAAPIDPAAAC
jgi:hypothetical protein